jgi:nucleoside-diphosphate-sugar epimerase
MKKEQNKLITDDCKRVYSGVSEKLKKLSGEALLITGGSGFMGSWLCELVYYMNKTHKMDIRLFITARDRERFEFILPHVANSKYVKFIRSDIRSMTELPSEVNYIVHAAANPDNRFHSSRPFETMSTVAEGTGAILRAASRASNLHKIINVSSSSIYSQDLNNDDKFLENSPGMPLNSRLSSSFSDANRYSEALCSAARSELRLPITTIRPFTFSGAYQDIDSPWALNNFINDAINKRPIRIHGDGETIRSYMYGADLAVWVLVIMLHTKNGQIYNVGNDNGISLREVAQKVANCIQPVPSILLNTSLTTEINRSALVPNVTKAEKEFGLKQFTSIDLAIQRSVHWYTYEMNGAYES